MAVKELKKLLKTKKTKPLKGHIYTAFIQDASGDHKRKIIEHGETGIVAIAVCMLRERVIASNIPQTELEKIIICIAYNGEEIARISLDEWSEDMDIPALHEKHKKVSGRHII
ncbi:hypothetical protein FACS1894103_4660 [Campylobacterota bacterium]|nr:hypothetical protein FACS1894103_4660 [Campylobacterota bacterium]